MPGKRKGYDAACYYAGKCLGHCTQADSEAYAIIICTSNYKSKDEIKEKLGDPIFNRFDGVIKFEDLSQEAKKMIAAKELKELDEEKIIPENVRKILVEQSTKLENAREIRKLIKDTKSLIEIREICK